MGFWFLQHDYRVSTHDDKQLVTGLHAQSFTGLTRDHNLVLG